MTQLKTKLAPVELRRQFVLFSQKGFYLFVRLMGCTSGPLCRNGYPCWSVGRVTPLPPWKRLSLQPGEGWKYLFPGSNMTGLRFLSFFIHSKNYFRFHLPGKQTAWINCNPRCICQLYPFGGLHLSGCYIPAVFLIGPMKHAANLRPAHQCFH